MATCVGLDGKVFDVSRNNYITTVIITQGWRVVSPMDSPDMLVLPGADTSQPLIYWAYIFILVIIACAVGGIAVRMFAQNISDAWLQPFKPLGGWKTSDRG
jgi:hypothetical protein